MGWKTHGSSTLCLLRSPRSRRGSGMRIRLALAAAVAALGIGSATAESAVSVTPSGVSKACSSRYTHAALSWGHKCLAVGQYCKRSGDRQYHRYRFHCHQRDSEGRYHLTQ